MSIASRITTMTEHIDDIYDTVELTGVDTTGVNKNLVNVPNTLKDGFVDIINNGVDTLYENFPKVAQTGEEPTLNGVYEAPMKVDLNGNTEQDSYSGKNFAIITPKDISNYGLTINYDTKTGKISIKGKANTTAGIGVANSSDLNIPSGEYTLSINKALPCLINYVVNDTTNTNRAFRIPAGSTNVTVNIPYNGISTGLFVAVENNVDYDLEFYLQLESGSTPTSFEPFVGGTASPNPDYPQDIRVVKGDNTIKVTGKNLLNVSNSYSVTTSQEVNINLETGTYSMSCTDITTDVTTGTSSLCNFYHSDNTFDQLYFSHTNKVGQITITAPVTKVKIYSSNSFNNSNGKTTTFTNLMIEKGSTATSYQPYQEQTYPLDLDDIELCKIGDYKDEIRKSTGKNLFDISNKTGSRGNNTFTALNQEITINSNTSGTESAFYLNDVSQVSQYLATTYGNAMDFNMTSVGGTYTLTLFFNYIPTNNVAIALFTNKRTIQKGKSDWENTQCKWNITLDNDEYIKSVQFYASSANVFSNFKIIAQLEKNNQATDYEPFGKVWYLRNRIGKQVFTDKSQWNQASSQYTDTFSAYKQIDDLMQGVSGTQLYCNYFVGNTYESTNQGITKNINSKNVIIRIDSTIANTLTSFRDWIETNTPTLYYPLENATITEITDTDLIAELEALKTAKSVEGQTNITQTNEELPFILDVSGLKKD